MRFVNRVFHIGISFLQGHKDEDGAYSDVVAVNAVRVKP